MRAPDVCPICGEKNKWKLIDSTKKGFNATKGVIGGMLLGPVGVAAGFAGKKKAMYQCVACGFSHEYDEKAYKEKSNSVENMQNTLSAFYIEKIKSATPDCVFCGKPQDLRATIGSSGCLFICKCCKAEYRCDFTIGGKVKGKTTQIIDCGDVNINGLQVGMCKAEVLVKDVTKIKS